MRRGSKVSFKEFRLKNGFIIGVFQGDRGKNPDLDIIVRYRKGIGNVRTPQHIHWAIDLLIKREHNRQLVEDFVRYLMGLWDKVKPFASKEEQQTCELRFTGAGELGKFEELDQYGEYPVEFIVHLIELLMIQEKNSDKAFMFKGVLEAILKGKDIFTIVSAAGFRGARR
jgi:hypothetical protein